MNTDFIPFTSYLLAALALAGVLVVGILAALVGETLLAASRTTHQRDEARTSLAAALGRVSHQA